jgi:integrase
VSRAGTKNVLPVRLPGPGEVDHDRLVIPAGPWLADRWLVEDRPGTVPRAVSGSCNVAGCVIAAYSRPTAEPGQVCYAHYWQWLRAGKPAEFGRWLSLEARPCLPRRQPPSRRTTPVDFTTVPPAVATEIRYVVGTKVTCGDWTPNGNLRLVLDLLISTVRRDGALSLLERRPADWVLLMRQHSPLRHFDRTVGCYFNTFFSTLQRGVLPDPWAEDKWLWRGCFDRILAAPAGREEVNLDWAAIRLPWLKTAAKGLAAIHLKAGDRSWATLQTWRRGLTALADYLIDEGLSDARQLDREVFLDFLAHVRETGGSKQALQQVNTVASVLESLQLERLENDLPTPIYLRRGENGVDKAKQPRPYPDDVIDRVDNLILADPEISATVRCMILLLRWGCPRISELIAIPFDGLKHNGDDGYWIEYWQNKTRAWRRFPIPADLATGLRAQQDRVRAAYPAEHAILFPSPARSSVAVGVARSWSSGGFRDAVRDLFAKHAITRSSMTGEKITGGEIHRYRHTVGTALLNNSWTQAEVQEFFGHATPTMTSHYGKILHSTLVEKAKAFHQAQEHNRTQRGLTQPTDATVERLRAKFTAVLPNGYCQLPASKTCEFRPNPCLDCAFFDPGGEELAEVHAGHRTRLTLLIDQQRAAGDQAGLALNEPVLTALDRHIADPQEGACDAS